MGLILSIKWKTEKGFRTRSESSSIILLSSKCQGCPADLHVKPINEMLNGTESNGATGRVGLQYHPARYTAKKVHSLVDAESDPHVPEALKTPNTSAERSDTLEAILTTSPCQAQRSFDYLGALPIQSPGRPGESQAHNIPSVFATVKFSTSQCSLALAS